jgi:hypothetical chaperone protein
MIRGIEWESHRKFTELNRLETCLKKNLIYPLFDSVEKTKVHLSDTRLSRVEFDKEDIVFQEELSRAEFEKDLSGYDPKVTQSLNDMLAQAGISREDVQGILTIGGSSKIPHYSEFLTVFFPKAKIHEGDLFGGVSKGLAQIGHNQETEHYIDMA